MRVQFIYILIFLYFHAVSRTSCIRSIEGLRQDHQSYIMAIESKIRYDEDVEPIEPVGALTQAPKLPDRYADESYKLFSKVQETDPTPEEAKRILRKCVWRILPFLCIGYHLMYVDKQTVCSHLLCSICISLTLMGFSSWEAPPS